MHVNQLPIPTCGRLFGGAAAVLFVLSTTAGPAAAEAPRGKRPLVPGQAHLAKASSQLLRARELALEGAGPAAMKTAEPGLELRDGRPAVRIKVSEVTPGLLAALDRSGIEVESSHPKFGVVYGRLDPARLAAVTALPEVRIVRPRPRVGLRIGDADNQADGTMNAGTARMALGFDGSGVTIGILSDSYNETLGGTESGGACDCSTPMSTCSNVVMDMPNQTSDDLPASVAILDDCTNPVQCSAPSDEGAAIGELMRDVAPGAGQMFHSAFNSAEDFAEGIGELVNCGADIIVDDVFYTEQPFFQDGVIAAAAQEAVEAGVPYFSATGNDATFGVADTFLDSDPAAEMPMMGDYPTGVDFHDFGGGDVFAEITVPDGCEIYAELQWAEPFENTIPDPDVGALSDLDLYILDSLVPPSDALPSAGDNILADSTTRQGCGTVMPPAGDPLETASYLNTTGGPDTVFIAIDHYCGATDPLSLRMVTLGFGPGCGTVGPGWDFEDGEMGETAIFVDAQIFGHPAARDVTAVGAIFFGELDGIGGFAPGEIDEPPGEFNVEPFSSLGGDLPFFFDTHGLPLPATQSRHKPEIVAPDGVDNTFFGSDLTPDSFEPGPDPNFFGTSAAAPNAAAIGALIADASDKRMTPEAMQQILEQTARDIEAFLADDLSGYGSVDAERALRSLDDTSEPLVDDIEFDLEGDAFLSTPVTDPNDLQPLQAVDTLTLANGDYSGIAGEANTVIFSDGFESGDLCSWGH